jgi:hypothetical protein
MRWVFEMFMGVIQSVVVDRGRPDESHHS